MCNPVANKIMERTRNPPMEGENDDNDIPNGDSSNAPSNDFSASVDGGCSDAKEEKNEQEVDSIREYDVLMGRGSGPNRHSGNIHFRAIVGETFNEFLSKHGSNRSLLGDAGGSEMMRIDPSTKNRLAQAVLDKITIEKKGRFLQKLNKKELAEAVKNGTEGSLIKAKACSLMDAAMASAIAPHVGASKEGEGPSHSGGEKHGFNPNAVIYYKIIPEKQILAKIKQTFRFLREQNEASNAEKQRQRARRVASASGVPGLSQLSGGLTGAHGLANNSSIATTYALMDRLGVNGINVKPSPIQDQLGLGNSRALSGIINPPTSSLAINAIKNLNQNTNAQLPGMNLAARLLCDLPQPKRIISTSEPSPAPSLLQGSALAAAVSQLEAHNKPSNMETSTKRLLEELTLSRLANLQKQRDDTITAYLAMERSTGATQGSAGIGNIGNPSSVMSGVGGISPSTQQLQRLLSLNAAAPGPLAPVHGNPTSMGTLSNSVSDPLSLLLQLNNGNVARNDNQIGRSSNTLRSFNPTSF